MCCVAVCSRVYVFRQSLGQAYTWTQEQELMIPEAARTLHWLSDVAICVGFKREYTVINITQGAVNDLSPIQQNGTALMKRLGKSDVWFMSLGCKCHISYTRVLAVLMHDNFMICYSGRCNV